MTAASDVLDTQTITVDGDEITLPDAAHNNEVVWFEFVEADTDDMELVKDASDTDQISLSGATSGVVTKGPFRLRSPNIPKFVRLGTGSTIRVTVVRSG